MYLMSQLVSNDNSHSLLAGLRVDCWVIQQSCLPGKTAKTSPLLTSTSTIAYLQPHYISYIPVCDEAPVFHSPSSKVRNGKQIWIGLQHTLDFKPEIYTL